MSCPVMTMNSPTVLRLYPQPDGEPLPILVDGHGRKVVPEAGGAGATLLTRRGPVMEVLQQPRIWGMGGVGLDRKLLECPFTGAEMQNQRGGLLSMNSRDPDVHRRHPEARRQIKHLFTREAAAAGYDQDKATVRDGLARLGAYSTVDVAGKFIDPAFITLIMWSLGLPRADSGKVWRFSDASFSPVHGTDLTGVKQAWEDAYAFYLHVMQKRMPRRGIVVGVVRATRDRPADWVTHLLANIGDGYPAVAQAARRVMWEALTRYHGDVLLCLAGLMDWRALAVRILNERALFPLELPRVLLAEEATVDGMRFTRGDRVLPSLVGAARDKSFPAPADDHIAVGYGPHMCPGWWLILLWVTLMLEGFFTTYPAAKLQGGEAPEWVGDTLAAPRRIMVRLR